jgi:hypothetical protein
MESFSNIGTFEERLEFFLNALRHEFDWVSEDAERYKNRMNLAILIAVLLLATGALLSAIPTFALRLPGQQTSVSSKDLVTTPLALAGIIYFCVTALKWREWSGWNYWRADEINKIYRKLMIKEPVPPDDPKLTKASKEYEHMVAELGKAADEITLAFTRRPK